MILHHGKPRNHPLQVAKSGPVDEVDDRATPPATFMPLDLRFGGFTIDVAASEANRRCERFYDRATNGLEQSWAGERVWCNPPYSSIEPWIRKAWFEHRWAECIVMLLPAVRTEQPWWQALVEPYRDRPGTALRCEFLPGRPHFLRPGQDRPGRGERPPFGCCLLIWSHPGPGPAAVVEQLDLPLEP